MHDDPCKKRQLDTRDTGWAWVTAVGVGIWNFLILGTVKSMGLLYMEWLELYNEDSAATSRVSSIHALTLTLLGPLCGSLSDRYSMRTARKVVFVGGFSISASIFASSYASNLTSLILTFSVLSSVFTAMSDTPILNLLSQHFVKRRVLANGIAFSGSSVGGLVLPPLIGWTNSFYGVRGTLVVLSAIWLHTLVISAVMFPIKAAKETLTLQVGVQEDEEDAENCVEKIENGQCVRRESKMKKSMCTKAVDVIADYFNFLMTPNFPSLMLTFVFAGFGYYNQFFCIPPFVTELGASKRTASFIVAAISITELVSRLSIGFLIERFKWPKTMIIGVSFAILLICGLIVGALKRLELFYAYIPILGLFGGVFAPLIIPLMVEIVPPNRIGSAAGLFPLLTGSGITVGFYAIGAIYKQTSSYQPGFLLCASMYSLALCSLAVHLYGNNSVTLCSKNEQKQSNGSAG